MKNKNDWCFSCFKAKAYAHIISKLTVLHDKHKEICAKKKDKR